MDGVESSVRYCIGFVWIEFTKINIRRYAMLIKTILFECWIKHKTIKWYFCWNIEVGDEISKHETNSIKALRFLVFSCLSNKAITALCFSSVKAWNNFSCPMNVSRFCSMCGKCWTSMRGLKYSSIKAEMDYNKWKGGAKKILTKTPHFENLD